MHPRFDIAAFRSALWAVLVVAGLSAATGCASIRPNQSASAAQKPITASQLGDESAGDAGEGLATAIWVKGHYAYQDGSYVWVPGHWRY